MHKVQPKHRPQGRYYSTTVPGTTIEFLARVLNATSPSVLVLLCVESTGDERNHGTQQEQHSWERIVDH